jgi:hypothetical protein
MKREFFSTDFRKNLKYQSFLSIRPVGVALFHANGHEEANSRFAQFCERTKKKKPDTVFTKCRACEAGGIFRWF